MKATLFPNPFDLSRQHVTEPEPGQTVSEILGGDYSAVRVFIGPREVPRALWPRTRPKQDIRVFTVPQGGDDVLRAVAAVAIAVVSGGVATGAIGGLTGWAAAAAGAGVAISGPLSVNRMEAA